MKLIVGLGNVGREYENTRHNMGFIAIDHIAKYYGVTITKDKFGGLYGEFNHQGEKVILLKPQRYINLSGEVIRKYVDFYHIPIDDILIIHDDLDLELGRIRLRYQGGSGGHNGLKNIEQHLKTKNYRRIKIGISNNKMIDTKDYVLGRLSKDAKSTLDQTYNEIIDIMKDYFEMTFDNLMNKYNK